MFAPFLLAFTLMDEPCCASMPTLVSNPAFAAAHLAPQAMEFKPKYGKMGVVKVATKEAAAFIVPPAKKVNVGVIMIHEWWGLNDHIKREAERLHEATGYGVVALDLYGGQVAATAQEAQKLMGTVDSAFARETVKVTSGQMKRGALLGRKMKKVGTVGYCFGGGWSFQAALVGGKDVDACVIFYGMPETDPDKLKPLVAPVLGIFGTQDGFINPQVVSKFQDAMRAAGKSLDVHNYDAAHAFANPSNPKYDKRNADDAWKVTLAFFKKRLG